MGGCCACCSCFNFLRMTDDTLSPGVRMRKQQSCDGKQKDDTSGVHLWPHRTSLFQDIKTTRSGVSGRHTRERHATVMPFSFEKQVTNWRVRLPKVSTNLFK